MPDKKPTYRIDENMLRSTLLGYTVSVDAAECNSIEQEVSSIRMQKAFVMPSAKIMIRFVIIPLLLVSTGLLLYFNMDYIRDVFTPSPEPKIKTEEKVAVPPPVTNTQTAAVNNVPPPVTNSVVAKPDTIVATANKNADTVKQHVSKQAVPVIAKPPVDSASGKPDTIKTNKVDTTSQRSSDPPVKKKKKKRRRHSAIDDLKESTLQPNTADDDVVVPQ